MLLGLFFVRPVPPPEQTRSQTLEDGDDDVREPALIPALHHNDSRTPLLNDDTIKDRYTRTDITTDGEYSNSVGRVAEVIRSVQVVSGQKHSTSLNVHGKALLSNLDFWLLFCIASMRMFPFSGFFSLLISYILQEQLLGVVIHVCLESF